MRALLVATLVVMCSLGAAAEGKGIFRIDIQCPKQGIPLTYKESGSMKVQHPSWVSEKSRPHSLVAYSARELSESDWQTQKIIFVPGGDGNVKFYLRGAFSRQEKDKNWVLVNTIKLNGELYPNGDFVDTFHKWGKTIPVGFWLYRKGKYFPDGGADGSPCVMVNHDNHLEFEMAVKKGTTYAFEFSVMAASEDLLED